VAFFMRGAAVSPLVPRKWNTDIKRRTIGRDRKHIARLLNRIDYEATMRRIETRKLVSGAEALASTGLIHHGR
jgi:hypothetical protein